MLGLINELVRTSKRAEQTGGIAVTANVLCIAERLLELRNGRTMPDPRLSTEANRFKLIEEYLISQLDNRIDIDDLASVTGLPARHIRRLVVANTGKSLPTFLRGLRITKAQSLLSSSKKTVTEIAYECGFGSSQYFSDVLRRSIGQTPTGFRNGREAPAPDEFTGPGYASRNSPVSPGMAGLR